MRYWLIRYGLHLRLNLLGALSFTRLAHLIHTRSHQYRLPYVLVVCSPVDVYEMPGFHLQSRMTSKQTKVMTFGMYVGRWDQRFLTPHTYNSFNQIITHTPALEIGNVQVMKLFFLVSMALPSHLIDGHTVLFQSAYKLRWIRRPYICIQYTGLDLAKVGSTSPNTPGFPEDIIGLSNPLIPYSLCWHVILSVWSPLILQYQDL